MTEDECIYEIPRIEISIPKRQSKENGILYVCIQCKKELSGYDVYRNYALCNSCQNPKIIGPPNLQETPIEKLDFVPGGSKRRFFYDNEFP